jgi:hypothetical protein
MGYPRSPGVSLLRAVCPSSALLRALRSVLFVSCSFSCRWTLDCSLALAVVLHLRALETLSLRLVIADRSNLVSAEVDKDSVDSRRDLITSATRA